MASNGGGGARASRRQLIRLNLKLPYTDLALSDKTGGPAELNDDEAIWVLALPYGIGPNEPRLLTTDDSGRLMIAGPFVDTDAGGSAFSILALSRLQAFNGTTWDRLRTAQAFDGQAAAGILAAASVRVDDSQGGTLTSLADKQAARTRLISGVNAAQTVNIDLRNLAKTLAIHSAASAGTATLLVEVSIDSVNFITVDSLAAASPQVKQYTETTVGATTALSPLAFRFIRITAGAAGVGNTTTLTISAK